VVETLCLLQNSVEDVIALEYMKCDDSKTTCRSIDPLTYLFNLELREPKSPTDNKGATDGENRIKMDMCNDLVHVVETPQFGSQHPFTRKNGIKSFWSGKRKDPLITQWIHTSSNLQPLQAPLAVMAVDDHVLSDFVDWDTSTHKVDNGGGHVVDMHKNWGRNKSSKLSTKDVDPSIQPAPDPVKLDPNLSPIGGETASTPISKFSSDLYDDVVDQDQFSCSQVLLT
jgi:hypothetical protein